MKWHGSDLEQQSGGGGQKRNDHDGTGMPVAGGHSLLQALGNADQVGLSGQAVEQRQTVGENSRGEGSQQQVFQRGFIRPAIGAQETHQNVSRDGHQLQADKDENHIQPGSHAHHSDDREKNQRIIFAVILLLDFEIAD